MRHLLKIVVEKHEDGYVAYPLGVKGAVVGEGDSYEEALADVRSAIRFHVESFGTSVLDTLPDVIEAFVAEAALRSSRMNANAASQPRRPFTMPNHLRLKAGTLRAICTQAQVQRQDFLDAFARAR